MSELRYFVRGVPIPQGSKSARVVKGRAILYDDNKQLAGWRETVAAVTRAVVARNEWVPPKNVRAELAFYFDRPKSVPLKRPYPNVTPDLDKLVRAVFDSITGLAVSDDALIVRLIAGKDYTTANAHPGVNIRIRDALNQEVLPA